MKKPTRYTDFNFATDSAFDTETISSFEAVENYNLSMFHNCFETTSIINNGKFSTSFRVSQIYTNNVTNPLLMYRTTMQASLFMSHRNTAIEQDNFIYQSSLTRSNIIDVPKEELELVQHCTVHGIQDSEIKLTVKIRLNKLVTFKNSIIIRLGDLIL